MQTIHMLGIGGAGMAALTTVMQSMGCKVSGSDIEKNDTLSRLEQAGIPITLGNETNLLSKADYCVYSAALDESHPLLHYAKQHMPTFSRGEMLGILSGGFATVAAVSGTHGKTTVCGMLTTILLQDEQNPSVLMGGHLPLIKGNGRLGNRTLLVCEACEYRQSFLHLKRDLGILLNVDNDHLECYGSMNRLKQGFREFISPCKTAVVCAEDENAMYVTAKHPNRFCYGLTNRSDCYATNIQQQNGRFCFLLHLPTHHPIPIQLKVGGKHNLLNALAAATAAWQLGATPLSIQKGLNQFTGVERRFEILSQTVQGTVADDYAHHPQEIRAVLTAAKEMGYQHITAVFQPFTYSRTKLLAKEFADALSLADRVILAPVMGGREPEDPTVDAQTIGQYLPNAELADNLTHCAELAEQSVGSTHLILTLGCGTIYRCSQMITKHRETLKNQV
ncbi:MAG: UDP-N-acetylmuramate--L-alanine ligase [Clostridia bacterium]|nr:UDP-N-acetylmuramate--L-alanine ligase [Clostridia bacterium]